MTDSKGPCGTLLLWGAVPAYCYRAAQRHQCAGFAPSRECCFAVVILFKSTGDAPILKQTKVKVRARGLGRRPERQAAAGGGWQVVPAGAICGRMPWLLLQFCTTSPCMLLAAD